MIVKNFLAKDVAVSRDKRCARLTLPDPERVGRRIVLRFPHHCLIAIEYHPRHHALNRFTAIHYGARWDIRKGVAWVVDSVENKPTKIMCIVCRGEIISLTRQRALEISSIVFRIFQ